MKYMNFWQVAGNTHVLIITHFWVLPGPGGRILLTVIWSCLTTLQGRQRQNQNKNETNPHYSKLRLINRRRRQSIRVG